MKLYTTGEYLNYEILFENKIMKSFFNKAKLNHNKSLSVNSTNFRGNRIIIKFFP